MNIYSERSDVEKLYRLIHHTFNDNFKDYYNNEEFIDLSNKFFKNYSERLKYLKRKRSTQKDIITIYNDQLVDITYYDFGHYKVGIINIKGEYIIYSITKDDYSQYEFYELLYDLYDNHLIFNSELDCKILKDGDEEAEEMATFLIDKMNNIRDNESQKNYRTILNDVIELGNQSNVKCLKYKKFRTGWIYSKTKKIFFIHLESLYKSYKKLRWAIYNEMSYSSFIFLDTQFLDPNFLIKNHFGNFYSDKIIKDYSDANFEISEDQIRTYDNNIIQKVNNFRDELLKINVDYSLRYAQFKRSIFIDNCLIDVSKYDIQELIDRIKTNIVYYYWWDAFSYDELCINVINSKFLPSTKKLIGKEQLKEYFKSRFNSKDELIEYLLSNFIPTSYSISQMKNVSSDNMFDYDWLFENEIIRSIRIFENECRIEFDEKIIGSFYNENLLFREMKKNFGDKFNIISQGSPEWLTPQRFDIYFPELNIAIEYQGEQHQIPVDFGGKGKKEAERQFIENKRRDILKKEKSDANDCTIIYVFPNYDLKKVLSDVRQTIKMKV